MRKTCKQLIIVTLYLIKFLRSFGHTFRVAKGPVEVLFVIIESFSSQFFGYSAPRTMARGADDYGDRKNTRRRFARWREGGALAKFARNSSILARGEWLVNDAAHIKKFNPTRQA